MKLPPLADALQAQVLASAACPDTSSWTLLGDESHRTGRCQHVLQAGQPVCLVADLRDAYGNLAGEHS